MRDINQIIVHCSATRPSMDIGSETIKKWHTIDNGWSDIGYHHVIRRDGTLDKGRDEEIAGAHARGHNGNSIGVCLVGGINDAGEPDANFTLQQYLQLDNLITAIKQRHNITSVIGHRDVSDKACPSFDVQQLLCS